MNIVERYELDTGELPTIPVPHDSIIEKIYVENEYLIILFKVEKGVWDTIKAIKPGAKSLIMRYHLKYEDGYEVLYRHYKSADGCYVPITIEKVNEPNEFKLEYVSHNIGSHSIIAKLWRAGSIVLDVDTDYIEYEWVM